MGRLESSETAASPEAGTYPAGDGIGRRGLVYEISVPVELPDGASLDFLTAAELSRLVSEATGLRVGIEFIPEGVA